MKLCKHNAITFTPVNFNTNKIAKDNYKWEINHEKKGFTCHYTGPAENVAKLCGDTKIDELFAFIIIVPGETERIELRKVIGLDDSDQGRKHWGARHKREGKKSNVVILGPVICNCTKQKISQYLLNKTDQQLILGKSLNQTQRMLLK